MNAEVISTGDEVISGQILDTNSQWLSLRLEDVGIRVLYHTAVGDDLEALVGVFRLAIQRCDVVLCTGGLGSTSADLTRDALAQATGRELVLDAAALEHIRQMFARRKREMPKRNERQALFPAGSCVIENPNGTAPGIALEVARPERLPCRLYALPGVPAEMREMWSQSVVSMLREAGAGQQIICHRDIKCFGASESQIEAMLPNLIHAGGEPRVGINASQTTIILRITAQGKSPEACQAVMQPTVDTIHHFLGSLVYAEDDKELQDAVVQLLRRRRQTLATAEWGTDGMVADWLASAEEKVSGTFFRNGPSGASQKRSLTPFPPDDEGEVFLGGIVVPNEKGLSRALDVPAELVARHGPISAEVASAMASACRQRFGADYGLAVSAFPQFDPQAPEPKPMFLALASPVGVQVKPIPFAGHPDTLKVYCGKHALNLVRLTLLDAG